MMFKLSEEMDLAKLRAFYLVGKYGNLPKAAHYLGVTPAAISIRLKKLEDELRVRIFDRYPNKLALTERGRILFKQVNHVFEALNGMQEAISREPDVYSGKLIIGIGSDLAKFFAPQIAAFSKEHPRLGIRILSKSSAEAIALVLEDDIDLGFSLLSKAPRGVEKKKLLDSRLYLIFPSAHPFSRRKQISLADVAGCRLITHGGGSTSRHLINSVFAASGIEIENILEASTCESIVEFVRLGLGVGFIHDFCLRTQKDTALSCSAMAGHFGGLEVSLVYRKSAAAKPAHQALINALVKSCLAVSKKSTLGNRIAQPGERT